MMIAPDLEEAAWRALQPEEQQRLLEDNDAYDIWVKGLQETI